MANSSKQFGAWGTGSWGNSFERASLRLTITYVMGFSVPLAVFMSMLEYTLRRHSLNVSSIMAAMRQPGDMSDIAALLLQHDTSLQQVRGTMAIGAIILIIIAVIAGYAMSRGLLKPIREAMWARKRFTADAAHDLRTPLAIMRTDTELALKERSIPNHEYARCLKSNLEEIERMTNIIENLLTLTRYDNVQSDLQFTRIDMRDVARRAVEGLRDFATSKYVDISMDAESDASHMIYGNAEALERMLHHLIRNGIKFTPQGGSVHISLEGKGAAAIIRITDTGIGIETEDIPNIFERFFKGERSRSLYKGSGLGLAIVQEIALKHKAVIDVKSEIGKGTCMTVKLPSMI